MNQLGGARPGDGRSGVRRSSTLPPKPTVFTTILTTDHWIVEMASLPRIVSLRRTGTPLESVTQVHQSFERLGGVLGRIPQRVWGLLFDVRKARPAHDAEIERAFQENRSRYYQAFGRFGVLVGTAAGVMQVKRMLRQTPDARIAVFSDEEQALHWVAAKDSVPPPPRP